MIEPYTMKHQQGFSLVELMIATTVASILSLAVVSTFASQSTMYLTQSLHTRATEDGRDAYENISRLIQLANASSFSITDNTTDITIDFTLPGGAPIWPNNVLPYTDNAVRIYWDNTDQVIKIGKASNLGGLAAAVMTPLTGNNDKLSTRITDLNLVELGGSQYYRLQIASSAGKGAFTASEIFDGLILPRN